MASREYIEYMEEDDKTNIKLVETKQEYFERGENAKNVSSEHEEHFCKICPKVYTDKRNLATHIRAVHKEKG